VVGCGCSTVVRGHGDFRGLDTREKGVLPRHCNTTYMSVGNGVLQWWVVLEVLPGR